MTFEPTANKALSKLVPKYKYDGSVCMDITIKG